MHPGYHLGITTLAILGSFIFPIANLAISCPSINMAVAVCYLSRSYYLLPHNYILIHQILFQQDCNLCSLMGKHSPGFYFKWRLFSISLKSMAIKQQTNQITANFTENLKWLALYMLQIIIGRRRAWLLLSVVCPNRTI